MVLEASIIVSICTCIVISAGSFGTLAIAYLTHRRNADLTRRTESEQGDHPRRTGLQKGADEIEMEDIPKSSRKQQSRPHEGEDGAGNTEGQSSQEEQSYSHEGGDGAGNTEGQSSQEEQSRPPGDKYPAKFIYLKSTSRRSRILPTPYPTEHWVPTDVTDTGNVP
ncbi:hypothetical protein McanMca71_001628 [Microsporum canis]|uniref:Uncharacterized protein n=1 Tax=Arthroderma otae (strain ATCC MYA-4605 / CBS 113480) TaxID=554155 RepID=C5FQ82_ARTOC|nr:uncharacterized protein MCYG_04854 [Microsporum canis CBS 113480]EEQ32035.1 predicted protein [Microsporum canis CBS 113480]